MPDAGSAPANPKAANPKPKAANPKPKPPVPEKVMELEMWCCRQVWEFHVLRLVSCCALDCHSPDSQMPSMPGNNPNSFS